MSIGVTLTLLSELVQGPSPSDRFMGFLSQIGSLPRGGGEIPFSMPDQGGSSNWEQVARQMAAQRGWTGSDWRAIDSIIERESGWDPHAVNDSSGAAGIAQRISGFGKGYSENKPIQQIRWLLNYLGDRYGDPQSALAFKDREGWY